MMRRIVIIYRRTIMILVLLLLGFLIWGMEALYAENAWKSKTFEPGLKDKIIIIDPGHGGADPGAVAGDIYEKDINLAVSEKLAWQFRQKGNSVFLTRGKTGGLNPEKPMNREERRVHLTKRKQFGLDKKGNIFISIHTNSTADPTVSGIVIFYGRSRPYSKLMAKTCAGQIEKMMHEKVVVKEAGFMVIDKNPIPAILIEVGFISNKEDLAKITNPEYQSDLARSIAVGIEYYTDLLGKVEAK